MRLRAWLFLLAAAAGLVCPGALPAQKDDAEGEITKLLEQGIALIEGGKPKEAVRPFTAALAKAEKELGKDHLTTARALLGLGEAYHDMGEHAKAEPLYKRGLAIREARQGKDHLDVATALSHLANLYKATGEYAKAEPLYRRGLAIREAKSGEGHLLVAVSLNNLAGLYRVTGQYAKAEPLYTRSLGIFEAKLGKDHPAVATALNNLALLYDNIGEYAKAEPLYTRSLAIQEAKLGKDHPEVAQSLNNLARLMKGTGQYARAELLYRRGLGIFEAKLGKDHPLVATALNNLANLYKETGQYAKAEPLYLRSLGIWEARLGKDHPDVATALNNLAYLYESMGQYAKAEPLYRRSLGIREARLGKDHPVLANSLNNLAALYMQMGQHAKAEPLYTRSLGIYEAALGKEHPEVAQSLNNLALLYTETGEYAKAEPHFRRALGIREAKLGKDHPDVAQSLNGLGLLYAGMGQHAKAEPLFRRSLGIYEAQLGKEHPAVATSLNNLANLYKDMGQHADAEPLYRRSLGIFEANPGKDHPDVATSLNNLASLLEALARTGEAARLFDRSRRGSRRHVSVVLPSLPPAEQAAFLSADEHNSLEVALSVALSHPADRALVERSAGWLLNGKAVAEEALAQSALLARDSRDPAAGKLAASLREARAELARLSLAAPAPGQEKVHRQRLEELAAREQDLARQLASAGGAASVAADWLELAGLRKALPDGAALIDVARMDVFDFKAPAGKHWRPARYAAWVTPAKGDVQLIDLGPADAIDAAVKDVRVALEGAHKLIRAKGEPEAEKALREPLAKLSKLVLTPLLPYAGKAKRWVVSPDGNLWLVPWEILLLPDGKYAVEQHTLSYVVSGRDLLAQSRWKGKPSRPLVVADPDFDLDGKTARAEAQRLLAKRDGDEETRGLSGLLRLGNIQRLPNSRAEAVAIAKPLESYAGQAPVQRLGKEALEGVVKAAKSPRVLCLSTHGFFLPTERLKPSERPGDEKAKVPPGWENPLLRCGLLLAGCNDATKSTDGDDGVLTGLEIVGMELRGCEMVVLSACETGLGDVQNGEGVAGLRQAFRLAGADSVVSTLWQVPDRSSAQLMTLFFANLAKGKGRATALREAQLKLIAERREDSAAAHPFFWAAFTLTGR
jgi:tetratricopeptide (TPR) repeat protein/CHAT domain-containing protein